MIINELPKLPDNCALDTFVFKPLPQHELQRLINKNVDEVWYWFATDTDECGTEGELIARRGTQYRYFCLTQYEDEPIIEFSGYSRWTTFTNISNYLAYRDDVIPLLTCITKKYSKASFNRKRLQLVMKK